MAAPPPALSEALVALLQPVAEAGLLPPDQVAELGASARDLESRVSAMESILMGDEDLDDEEEALDDDEELADVADTSDAPSW